MSIFQKLTVFQRIFFLSAWILFSLLPNDSHPQDRPKVNLFGYINSTKQNMEALKSAGWEIYDTEEKIKGRPRKWWRYQIEKDLFKKAWNQNRNGIREVLKKERGIIFSLLDSKKENDELNKVYIHDEDYISLNIGTTDTGIGTVTKKFGRVYSANKKLSKEEADRFRKISGESLP